MRSFLFRVSVWVVALAVLAALVTLAFLVREQVRARLATEAADLAEVPKRAANKVIKLGAEFAASHGIADEPSRPTTWAKRATAYGRVVPNPRAASEIHVAFAGTLRPDPARRWPTLGTRVQPGQILGWLDVRVGPQERLDLVTKLAEARQRQAGAEDLFRVRQERYDRLRGAGAGVSQSELDLTRTELTDARTQRETARATVKSWQEALAAIEGQGETKGKTWSQPLTAPLSGEIIELAVHPGSTVEPGALVARLVDFRQALVRLEIPPEALSNGPPAEVELSATWGPTPLALEGASNRPEPPPPARTSPGRLLGPAPQVEPGSQYSAYWYEVDTDPKSATWRPGLFVMGSVKVEGEADRPAVSVPEAALLYHEGRALVYVRIGPGRYERREVQVVGRAQGRWVLAGGVEAGEPVVAKRAQVLLSEEFRGEADLD
jgi:multidrug efflux pump subunit AcrA (membrane-fusion protein)